MECPYHGEMDKRVRGIEVGQATAEGHDKDLAVLFRYYETISEDVQQIKLSNRDFAANQQSQILILTRIDKSLGDHLKGYAVLEAEFKNFAWFRTQLNWLKDRLPWWILSIIAIGMAILFISLDGVKKVIDFFR